MAEKVKFNHGELVVAARSEKGFRRAGYTFPASKTVIPAATLTKEQYDLIVNEPMLVYVEGPRKALTKDAPVNEGPVTPLVGGGTVLGGALETATPQQLAAAEQGVAVAHPAVAGNVGTGKVQSTDATALDLERQRLDSVAAKKDEGGEAK